MNLLRQKRIEALRNAAELIRYQKSYIQGIQEAYKKETGGAFNYFDYLWTKAIRDVKETIHNSIFDDHPPGLKWFRRKDG